MVASYLCVGAGWGIGIAQASSAPEPAIPDARQHQMKAPPIDFEHLRDPFTSYLDTIALRGQRLLKAQQSKLFNRKREPLEVFDLSTLSLVGIYKMGDQRVAMVQDSQGKGYTVHQGNYMGKNSGQVEKIDEDTIYLVERMLNAEGQIVDQQVTLTLKEVNN
ncbi:MAG: pilus assembly protein PilP [Mariprofundaceae bacterium]|nr:pilus assembly protein PilP [Mariprofundaceae bacterium]